MNREDFMRALAEVIRPRSAQAGATILIKMLSFLNDLPDDLFTDEALQFIAPRLPRNPSLGQMRTVLNGYAQSIAAPRADDMPPMVAERIRHEERQAHLRDDWDDPAGISRKVRTCDDGTALGHRHLLVLAKIVGKYAPHHLGLLPPRIIEEIARDPEVTMPVFVNLRAQLPPMPRASAPIVEPLRPRTAYLTQDQLDQMKGKRHDPTETVAVDPATAEAVEVDWTVDHTAEADS